MAEIGLLLEEGRDCAQSRNAEQGPGSEGWPDRRGWAPPEIDGRASAGFHVDVLSESRFLGPMVVRSVELRQPCQEARTKHMVSQRAVHMDCVTACRYRMPLMHHVNTCGFLVALMMPQDRSN